MKTRSLCLVVIALSAALAAGCGARSALQVDTVPKASALVEQYDVPLGPPGRLEGATTLNRIAASEIERAIDVRGRKAATIEPRYDVTNHRLIYSTTDGRGRPIKASGLISVPVKAPGAPSPVLSYQHATLFKDARAPSNHAVPSELAVVLASLGYIVVAADYVGYGVSRGALHPYLLAEPSAAAVLDFLESGKPNIDRAESLAIRKILDAAAL